jgi:hypothetical protein
MTETLLRWSAVAIAALAWVDPSLTLSGRVKPRVGLIVQHGASMELPAAPGRESRRALADVTATRVRALLASDYEVVDGPDPDSEAMIVVGDRYPDESIPGSVRTSTVAVSSPLFPNVRITEVGAPREVPPATNVRIRVRVEGAGVRGATSVLAVRAGGVNVGQASHVWSSDQEIWRAEVDAVPVGAPPFTLELLAQPLAVEATAADNRFVVTIDEARRLRVLVFEARPSWASAFARRALESDARFDVSSVGLASPAAAVKTGARPELPVDRLDEFDLIVVGGLDRLSSAEIGLLDRFVRDRGGAVALVPDARPPVALTNVLLPGVTLGETLLEQPAALETGGLVPLDASELLQAVGAPQGVDVLARTPNTRGPIVWSMAHGEGRVLFSGAMDAWRYRANREAAFDRFWRSVASGLALAAAPPVDVTLAPVIATRGDRVQATARLRLIETRQLGDRLAMTGDAGGVPLRFWPASRVGEFTGSTRADQARTVRVTAAVAGSPSSGTARLTIDDGLHDAGTLLPLSVLAATHGGVNVTPADLSPLAVHMRSTVPARSAQGRRHPMRTAWWLAPFTICLSAEWWLRRRRGAR